MRILLTGFGPFPGAPFNPSAALVAALAKRRRPALAAAEIATHVFATSYAGVDHDLPPLLARKPEIVLMFGVAGCARELRIETLARNAATVLFPDADGCCARHGVIAPGAPAARRGRAPFARLVAAARRRAVPARLSRNAGRYLCNYAYWRALEHAQDLASGGRPLVQFIHMPPLAGKPRRQRGCARSPSFAAFVTAAEAVLIALMTASRH